MTAHDDIVEAFVDAGLFAQRAGLLDDAVAALTARLAEARVDTGPVPVVQLAHDYPAGGD
jgi:hypothetical protein